MKKKYLVILGVVLILICFIVTIASGRQYTLVIPCIQGEENIENYDISADQNYEIFRVTDKYIRDGKVDRYPFAERLVRRHKGRILGSFKAAAK